MPKYIPRAIKEIESDIDSWEEYKANMESKEDCYEVEKANAEIESLYDELEFVRKSDDYNRILSKITEDNTLEITINDLNRLLAKALNVKGISLDEGIVFIKQIKYDKDNQAKLDFHVGDMLNLKLEIRK